MSGRRAEGRELAAARPAGEAPSSLPSAVAVQGDADVSPDASGNEASSPSPSARHLAAPHSALDPSALRARIAQADAALAARFDGGEDVDRLLAARSTALDGVVRDAWDHCLGEASDLALFAVGGYGRGELFPQSDIDLLVLAGGAAQAAHAEALARFFALLWDAGIPLGHAVRSPAQTTQAAHEDITVMTAQLDARLLQGDPAHVDALADAVAPARLWPAPAYFIAKREEQRQRHARFGDTSDNLEPNLKDGPGGLRDLQTLRWMAMRVSGARDLESLIALGQLGADEYATLDLERRALARLRFGLHLVAGRREERLRFDHQKALAARLGHVDDAGTLAVERMMQVFYRSAARVQRIGDRLLQRFEEQLEGEAEPVVIDARFELRRGYLAAREAGWPMQCIDTALDAGDAAGSVAERRGQSRAGPLPQDGPPVGAASAADASADGPVALEPPVRPAQDTAGITGIFALFAAWAADPAIRGLHSRTARALAEALKRILAYADATPAERDAFMALLRGPQPVRTLERMARLGVLGRWLPAFARVSGRMQFDLFHVYTVDQHTLAVLRNVQGFASGQADERFAIAHDVWPRLHKPELLLLAALFHDIAKGRGGDHSELGAVDADAFCRAHALPAADAALVSWLVAQHLLMSVTAQKQDIADPAVIHRFADRVGDRDRLDYLYLLTCADIAGTSPKLWNAWKDRLLADLYAATRAAFRRGLEHPVAADERVAETMASARALLDAQGMAAATIDAAFARLPEQAFLRGRPEQVAWQAGALHDLAPAQVRVRVRAVGGAGSLAQEVFVHSPDRDGLFAAIVATLDRLGLAVQRARVLDAPGGAVSDVFEVLPVDPARTVAPADAERKLRAVLSASLDAVRPTRRTQPRHLRHFRIPPRIAFDDAAGGTRTALSLVCTDRPGLLADVAQVLRAQRLRVHDARIATFGERAEDVFQVTDERNAALDPARRQALHDALLQALDGEQSR